MIVKFLVSTFALILFLINFAPAKIEIIKDSRGTDFWLTFLPNYHNNWSKPDPREKYGDSLYIFISADEPTKGSIEYFKSNGQQFITNFEIIDPQDVYVFSVPSYDFALLGYNVSGTLYNSPVPKIQTETVVLNSFHVVSEKKVSVYGLSQAVKTSDAFIVLPTNVLGNRYFILSYPSDGIQNFFNPGQSTPSQFAIVATEDNTQITIYPKAETYRYGRQVQNIILNKGEVYLVQAKIRDSNLNSDLTGTEIVANKPIAVFSGHQRATVPVSLRNSLSSDPSRDILIEQMPPVSTWGRNSIVVPFAKSRNEFSYGNNLFRILAAEDDTEVLIDGVKVATLSQGSFYEGILDKPHYILANKPILVGAFKKTCGTNSLKLGDPFFTI
ncbi:MAG: IgGFc-binding protein, partial [Candidatus Kapaibacteriota bacterium]